MHPLPHVGLMVVPVGMAAPTAAQTITVAAVQARLQPYAHDSDFRTQMAGAVERAMECAADLIVFPEDVASGLAALHAPAAARTHSMPTDMAAAALAHPGPATRALLLAAADRMRAVYVTTFSDLAREHAVYIAAGTTLLPHEGHDGNAIYNTFFLFGPDGAVAGTADKVNLIPLESDAGLDLTPGAREDLTAWQTPIGTIGPLICLDAWDTGLAASLVEQGAQVLVVPSANPEVWNESVLADRKEGLFARVRELGVPGVEAFGVGSLAGSLFQGRSWILVPDDAEPEGVRIVARASTATEPEVISATIDLPARRPAAPQT